MLAPVPLDPISCADVRIGGYRTYFPLLARLSFQGRVHETRAGAGGSFFGGWICANLTSAGGEGRAGKTGQGSFPCLLYFPGTAAIRSGCRMMHSFWYAPAA